LPASIFDEMARQGHEQVIFCHDDASGLHAIIAIHDTTLGPALGGARMWAYETEDAAVSDALRLSRGMTFKSAAAGTSFGGGKCVIWGDPQSGKSEALFRALGRFVHSLGGRFITGTDVGTASDDFVHSRAETPHVVALPEEYGGSGDSGHTTALALWHGIAACLEWVHGRSGAQGRRFAIQGLGKVGRRLLDMVCSNGGEAVVADIDCSKTAWAVREYGASAVAPDAIYEVQCDIFSPNALGAVLNDDTIPRLRCKIVAGAANNQLAAEDTHSQMLADRGILYAPDYVINAGGLIQVAEELHGFDRDRADRRAAAVGPFLTSIFEASVQQGLTTQRAADLLVRRRLEQLGQVKRNYIPR
jgi:leucine dehydrogenase